MKKFILLLLPCALALAFSGPALAHTGLEFFLMLRDKTRKTYP